MDKEKHKIAYVSGIFENPLSVEVINLLAECKEHCEKLIVGVYSDDLILRFLSRPANYSYEKRKNVLQQYRCVDEIIEVNWGNVGKQESYEQLHYDLCFYGSEYGKNYLKDCAFFAEKNVEFKLLQKKSLDVQGKSFEIALQFASYDKDIVLFGTGNYFDSYMKVYGNRFPPAYAIDNNKNKQGTQKKGVQIFSLDKLKEKSSRQAFVVICAKNCDEMEQQIIALGDVDFRTFYSVEEFGLYDEFPLILAEEKAYLREAHRMLMLCLDEFDRVCKKYNLKYFLQGGSLIGAVRHQTLIPWDDDIDVAMYRADFEKLKAVAFSEWSDGDFRFVPYDKMGENVFHDFLTRLVYIKEEIPTSVFAKSLGKLYKNLENKICMDIYVLDEASENSKNHARHAFVIKTLYGLAMGHRVKLDFADYEGNSWFIKLSIFVLSIIGKLLPLGFIFWLYERSCKKYHDKNHSGKVYEVNGPLCMLHSKLDKSLLGDGTYLNVCGHDIMVPEHYADYLEIHGYHNFMHYPPGNLRKPTHWIKNPNVKYTL